MKTRAHLSSLKSVQIGGCTGLSFQWIQRHKRFATEKPTDRIEFLNSDGAWTQIDYFAKQFNSWRTGGTYPERVEKVTPHTLGGQMGEHHQEFNTATFSKTLAHLNNNPGYHIVIMELKGANTNHVCALHQDDNKMTFFDPNSGEYSLSSSNRASFLKNLETQYGTYVTSGGKSQSLSFESVHFCHVA
ncbi:YopT-type cysteine protease domain-containing protein [Motiliproteus sp. MSK22-1]|uniref:YopT-type cysteine protease domain-containing protein n=1 Tax=Motiliproteus sp. MSK22-1 TaxID=1897630 RepID=UPI001300DE1E|nr:YopT-type cysteine protease domain-containing protein [Motiliproteus sp. MSK22-1]